MKKVILSMIVLSAMILTGCGGSASGVASSTNITLAAQDTSIPNTGAFALPAVPTLPETN